MPQHAHMTAEALADYFSRISYTGPAEPTLDVLAALVAAHNRSIPFENLDPLMGVPVADLGTDALFDKLVRRRRGGYCFEQNGVMEYVLSQLGFGVDALGGRVVWMNTSGDAARSDPSDAGGDGARRRRPLPRRRRVRRPDPVVADPVGGRHRAADPPRAVPDSRARRRLPAGERDPRRLGAAVHVHHQTVSADRSGRSEAGMSQRIRNRVSSPGSPPRSSPTTRGGTCAAATSPSTARGRPSGSASTPRRRCSRR